MPQINITQRNTVHTITSYIFFTLYLADLTLNMSSFLPPLINPGLNWAVFFSQAKQVWLLYPWPLTTCQSPTVIKCMALILIKHIRAAAVTQHRRWQRSVSLFQYNNHDTQRQWLLTGLFHQPLMVSEQPRAGSTKILICVDEFACPI